MTILIKAAQLILSLSILVIIHELGHFIAAKCFKTRVEKFYLFFNPWFSLFKFKKGETEYGVGWLPLGGYVKISGMIDESLDKEQMKEPPKPWEFRSKPAYQRLIIMLGGVIMNILLAIIIYIGTSWMWGDTYLPTSEVNKYGIVADSLAQTIGLQNGDKIVSIDNQTVEDFNKITSTIVLNNASTIKVERNGELVNINLPKSLFPQLIKYKNLDFISPRMPLKVDVVFKNYEADKAGIKPNDVIISVNNQKCEFYDQIAEIMQNTYNKTVSFVILRNTDTIQIPVYVNNSKTIGIQTNIYKYCIPKEIHYNFFQSIPIGIKKTWSVSGNYLKQLKMLVSPELKVYKQVGGFISIGNLFPSQWDWHTFWNFSAFLSIMLAILNVLPIPALDGGHVLFLFYEIITRKKPSDKFMEYSQIIGMLILFSLLIFANANDIIKLFK